MGKNNNVFVYGTLMEGFGNHCLLDGCDCIGDGVLLDYGMYQVSGYFPGVMKEEFESVVGEVYSVDDETMLKLDRLEGNGYMYNRVTEVVVVDGVNVLVNVYSVDGSEVFRNVKDRYKKINSLYKWNGK